MRCSYLSRGHWLLTAGLIFLVSCGGPGHMPIQQIPTTNTASVKTPTWDNAIGGLVQARCSFCHNPRNASAQMPNYTDFRVAHERRDRILFRVYTKGDMPMPPYNALITPAERKMFADWAKAGAPKSEAGAGKPEEIVQPEIDAVPGLATALKESLNQENLQPIDRLVSSWGYARAVDEQGRPPIISVIAQIDSENLAAINVVRRLLENGASPNSAWRGVPALVWALQKDFTQIALLLVEKGGDVNATVHSIEAVPAWSGYSVLMVAVEKGNGAVVQALLGRGAKPDYSLPDGKSAEKIADKLSDPNLRKQILEWLKHPPNAFE
jgi:hypothetical protein